jgi:pectate lyase
MKKLLIIIAIVCILVGIASNLPLKLAASFYGSVTEAKAGQVVNNIPAFPGAQGFGAETVGGRGGKVYQVTNLNDSGTGSIRACINATGARICVFTVGGTITINSPLTISNPFITIAGQTASGGGITIKTASGGDVFLLKTHDVIIRFISARPGPGGSNHASQIASNGIALYNIIIDHSTFSWGVDSNIETWYRVYNSTIQWSLISEALDCSTHPKGCHSKGLMIGGYAGSESKNSIGSENITVHHNLMAHNGERNPLMQLCGTAQVINNVTYNPQYTFSHQQNNCIVSAINYINWIGNYHKKGLDSTSNADLKVIPADDGTYSGGAKVYVKDNIGPSRPNDGLPDINWVDSKSRSFVVTVPAEAPFVTTTDALTAYNDVLADAGNSRSIDCDGNWYNRRDSIDARIVNDVKNGTGHIIDSPSEVGGWIIINSGIQCSDTDHDGMSDTWEMAQFGSLSQGSTTASTSDFDGDGYTDLEEFLNGTNPRDGRPASNPTPTPAYSSQLINMYLPIILR